MGRTEGSRERKRRKESLGGGIPAPPTPTAGSGRPPEGEGQEELVRKIGVRKSSSESGLSQRTGRVGREVRDRRALADGVAGDEELRLATTLSRSRSGGVEQKKASAASSLRHTAASAASSLREQRPTLAP
jgi:hypothetical protein